MTHGSEDYMERNRDLETERQIVADVDREEADDQKHVLSARESVPPETRVSAHLRGMLGFRRPKLAVKTMPSSEMKRNCAKVTRLPADGLRLSGWVDEDQLAVSSGLT